MKQNTDKHGPAIYGNYIFMVEMVINQWEGKVFLNKHSRNMVSHMEQK